MGVNKIVYNTADGARTLIDLTGDSVTPETLAEGATAHDASGDKITGTMKPAKPTQFTNLYDPAKVLLSTYINYSNANGLSVSTDVQVNNIMIPYHHLKGEPFSIRVRGIGTVRDRNVSVCFDASGENRVNHFDIAQGTYTSVSFDEYGDAVISVKGAPLNYEWYYFSLNFQYVGVNKNATAMTGPIITINEPIGNGGYVE